ncbi:uroporphyrinogen-III C-methyltransferase [Balneatrix alpica]|uniref:uroporphyrinogen-III C-methyltransferase n=1 Tax=Balneatrix alpica TaxID=75684 RepID=UPI002739F2E3|nr:uroporphyrinogen-III C-methyltransferase [Balneatrix alpica]
MTEQNSTPDTPANQPQTDAPSNKKRKDKAAAAPAAQVSEPSRDTQPAEQTEQPAATAQEKVSQPTEPPLAPSNKAADPAAKASKAPLVIAILLGAGALAFSGYTYWQLQQQQQLSSSQLSILEASLSSVQSSQQQQSQKLQENLQGQLGDIRQQQQKALTELAAAEQRIDTGLQQMRALTSTSRTDWQLAEIEYLLRLANQRILTEGTASGALALLQSADAILRELDDVSVYPVRKALAEDLAKLEAIPKLDVEGSFLRLAALNQQVDQLSLLPVTDQETIPTLLKEVAGEEAAASWGASLSEAWDKAWRKLNELVVVHKRDGEVQPLLSPQEHFYLQQNLHLMLEQAQLALLQGKQQAYDASLDKALEWIPRYFNQEQAATQALLQGLKELRQLQVAPQLPDISNSLNTLKAYLKAIHGPSSQQGGSAG